MTEKWYDCTPEITEQKLNTSIYSGLSKKTAAGRLKRHGGNVIFPVPKGPFYLYLKHILTDLTSILLVFTALTSMLFGQNTGAAVLLCILAVNIAAAVFTYIKAQRVLEDMGRHALPTAKVMREGKLYLVKQELLVPGDIIFVSAGDIVPADARLVESSSLTVLETNLTGEAHSTEKDASFIEFRDIPISGRKNMIYASTIITGGSGKAVVCDVGEDTLVYAMGKISPIISHEKLRVFRVLKKYCSVWSIGMIAMIFALTVFDLAVGYADRGLFDIFLTGLTLAVASMSEFYTAFGYIIVACGIFGAVRRRKDINSGALIKSTAKLEVLKNITCLVVPKEALFSARDAKIDRIVANGKIVDCNMPGFAENSAVVLRYAVISTGLYGSNRLVANNMRNENVYSAEEDSIISAARKHGLYNIELENRYPILEHLPVSRLNRFETTLASFGDTNIVVLRGDAQSVLGLCRYYSEKGRVFKMTPEKLSDLQITASQITKEAFRVIAIASKNTTYTNLTRIVSCQSDLTFEGFICIREPLLPGAAMNISRCKSAGIKVIMICDDTDGNNRYIANALGIVSREDEIITSQQMAVMKEGLFRVNAPLYRLYMGLDINQKRRLIGCLKDSGEIVGVLARGIDEIILLRDADAGFSQSITISPKALKTGVDLTDRSVPVYAVDSKASLKTGCEATKFLSDVIVSEPEKSGSGGFNAMINSIACSKVIYQNLLRAVRYLLASQSARLFCVLYSSLSRFTLLDPVKLLFCGLIIDFIAVIAIAFEQPARDILSDRADTEEKLRHPLRHNIESLLFGLLLAALSAATPVILGKMGINADRQMLSSAFFWGFILTQLILISEVKKDGSVFMSVSFNRVNGFAILMSAAFIAASYIIAPFGNLFGIVRPAPLYMIVTAACPAITLIVYEIYKIISNSGRRRKKRNTRNPGTESGRKTKKSFFFTGFRMEDIDNEENDSD